MTKSALILGASGRVGRHMSETLQTRGWQVESFDRTRDDLAEKSQGKDAIIYGWNPPYHQWEAQCKDQLNAVIKAAQANDAVIFFPGNVYIYGQEPSPWSVKTRPNPVNALGQIRADMEQMLQSSGVKAVNLRAGDFVEREQSGNWFDAVITKKLSAGRIANPAKTDCPHSWAYLPDYARAGAALLDGYDPSDARYQAYHFKGFTITSQDMANAISAALGRPVKSKKMSWMPLYALSPFWPLGRKIIEMRYLWDTPHSLDDNELRKTLPDFEYTSIEEAMRTVFGA